MRSSAKASPPRLARGLARRLVIRAVDGDKTAIRRLQAVLGRAGRPIGPEPLEVTLLWFGDAPPPSTEPRPMPPAAPQPTMPRR